MAGRYVRRRVRRASSHFNLVVSNGQVIATSEAYESKESAKEGIESVRANASSTTVGDQTI